MKNRKFVLLAALQTARNTLNTVAGESSDMGVHANISDIITQLGNLEREVKTKGENITRFFPNNVCLVSKHNWELGQDKHDSSKNIHYTQWKCKKCHSIKVNYKKEEK